MSTPPTDPGSACVDPTDDTVVGIIGEFSEVFSFVRSRSARYAKQIHPDLKNSGIFVLHTVLRSEPITATELAQRLEMDKAMVSRQVTLLRSLGLVETEPDPNDRRSTLLRSTEQSRAKVTELRRQMGADYRARFTDWSPEDLSALRDSLRRFNDAAE